MANPRTPNNPQQQQQPATARQPETTQTMQPYRGTGGALARGGWSSSPFSFMRRFMSDMDRLFDDFGMSPSTFGSGEALARGLWAPQIDVFERNNQLVVHADLPGLRSEDVKVNVEPGLLTISGERKHEHEHEQGGVYQCERSYGSFQRAVPLPEGIEPDQVQANFENGVLEVTMPLPKQQQPKGRSVPISSKAGGSGGVKH